MQNLEKIRTEFQEILAKPIRELGLKLEGSAVERFVQRLYRELQAKGLHKFRPHCYLTDEWGCPSGEPVVGIPFYLASAELSQLEHEMNDLEDDREIMMYMRHEAGHAFNYAYQLYKSAEWGDLFGPFRRAYRDHYRPVPFSREFVRHMAGWYAQKHPDEDFAETFAVWLTPRAQWRKRYQGWGALAKLEYVDRMARKVGDTEPSRRRGHTDVTVDEMESTVGEFYRLSLPEEEISIQDLGLDTDLADIFNISGKRRKGVRPAQEMLQQHRKHIVDKVAYWSGVQRPIVKRLVEAICKRVEDLGLRVDIRREADYLTEFTVYTTALSMNYLVRGKFIYP
ncbi:MAG TPA: putative zinc-binding metallopeptidase [Acidobacteriaceae bacterium]|nr:putative zinc-binding metallopeptidase [Acidobacteriaceae bacterium]